MRVSEGDHALVTAAVAEAEGRTSGEIVTVVAPASDRYHDVALHWAVLLTLGMLAYAALFPGHIVEGVERLSGGWVPEPSLQQLFTTLLILAALTFTIALLLLRPLPVRMWLTPPATKTRRVRRRAVELFRVAAERRTHGRTGVILYLSLAERRAEIVADEAIHAKVAPEVWGEAMAAVVAGAKSGRTGEGMAEAVREMGDVLAAHFPRAGDDRNELPDRLITL